LRNLSEAFSFFNKLTQIPLLINQPWLTPHSQTILNVSNCRFKGRFLKLVNVNTTVKPSEPIQNISYGKAYAQKYFIDFVRIQDKNAH
jgi:hypothetical protein